MSNSPYFQLSDTAHLPPVTDRQLAHVRDRIERDERDGRILADLRGIDAQPAMARSVCFACQRQQHTGSSHLSWPVDRLSVPAVFRHSRGSQATQREEA